MAYDEVLSLRVEKQLLQQNINFVAKKMFGGMAYMINDKMCVGIVKNELMLHVLEEVYESLLEENHVRPMNFTGKIMKRFLFIEEEALTNEEVLFHWVKFGLDFGERGIVKTKKKK
jgi:TfoX/Sxy family transcriptional regulator of competence genes